MGNNDDLETLQRKPSFSNRKKMTKRHNSSTFGGASSSKKKMSRTPDQPL
jgi:hypothetical protein